MCSLCTTCVVECYCPRCPHRAGKLLGYPPRIQACSVCGAEDDRDCADPVCAITEHYMNRSDLFCQMCVENTHKTRFPSQMLGMYCRAHELEHKRRMRLTLA